MKPFFEIRPQVREALDLGKAVVALETTLISHGLPYPRNLETAQAMESAVREQGATPATIGIVEGCLIVGLLEAEVRAFAEAREVAKVSRRDLAAVVASGEMGATTVAATAWAARRAGICVVATGGIGGVHRGGERSLDISADLQELAHTPVAVVCSGAKAILDLVRTLEVLETLGVPVIGYGTNELPAFFSRESGIPVEYRVDSPAEAAAVMAAQWSLGLTSGIVFANPPPSNRALESGEVETLVGEALQSAAAEGIEGKDVTPYLLSELSRRSAGRTLESNVALLEENARIAALIAGAAAEMMAG